MMLAIKRAADAGFHDLAAAIKKDMDQLFPGEGAK